MKLYFILLFLLGLSNAAQSQISELEAESYLGKYKIETNHLIAEGEVLFENQNLVFLTEGIPRVILMQMPEYVKFKAVKFEIILQFLRDDFKEVIAVKIYFQGQEFLAKKV